MPILQKKGHVYNKKDHDESSKRSPLRILQTKSHHSMDQYNRDVFFHSSQHPFINLQNSKIPTSNDNNRIDINNYSHHINSTN